MKTASRGWIALVAITPLVLSACASDRYVGSIGRDGTYANRGYGVSIALAEGGLRERWDAIDPQNLDAAAAAVRPTVHDEPLDLDGDGQLDMGETTRFLVPMLRLTSRTSTGAVMSVDVTILGKNNANVGLEALLLLELAKLDQLDTSSTAPSEAVLAPSAALQIPYGYQVRIAEVSRRGRVFRIALVDQAELIAENGKKRRQIVRVLLAAPSLTDDLRRDQDLLLEHLYLGRRGGSTGAQESW